MHVVFSHEYVRTLYQACIVALLVDAALPLSSTAYCQSAVCSRRTPATLPKYSISLEQEQQGAAVVLMILNDVQHSFARGRYVNLMAIQARFVFATCHVLP